MLQLSTLLQYAKNMSMHVRPAIQEIGLAVCHHWMVHRIGYYVGITSDKKLHWLSKILWVTDLAHSFLLL